MAQTKPSRQFRNTLSSMQRKEIVIPAIRIYLYSRDFPGFTVNMEGWEVRERKPDGWFHPSTHPLWTPRQLYYYLAEPDRLVPREIDMTGIMAITAGVFWHAFLQACLLDDGILEAVEVDVEDPETGSRGSLDGRLRTGDGWEFKTMNQVKLGKLDSLQDFIERCPDYYAQVQEYMRISGLRRFVVTIVNTSYPFDMREIIVPYEQAVAERVRDKYLRVRQVVADQRLPEPCCAPRSKESKACMARTVCPIAN